jgi:amidase
MVFDDALDAQAPTAVTINPISDGAAFEDSQAASTSKATWQQTAASKQRAREALLLPDARLQQFLKNPIKDDADLSGLAVSLLTDEEAAIIAKPAHILAADIAARRLTSYQVTLALCKAATIAQDTTNCLTEIFFQAGLIRARSLDAYQAEHDGKTIGPLHGVPVSVKDHIDVEGMDGPSGFVGWCGNCVADSNALAVQCLVEAGAVIYCKTSNPQSLLVSAGNGSARAFSGKRI